MVILIIGLFCLFVFFSPSRQVSGFEVLVDDKLVLSYYYSGEEVIIEESWKDSVIVNENLIKIYFNSEKTEYNVIKIDNNSQASVVETSCKKQECLHFPPLKNNDGIIICLPHSFVLQSIIQDGGVTIG